MTWLALLSSMTCAAEAQRSAREESREIKPTLARVFSSSGTAGRLVRSSCAEPPLLEPGAFGRHAATMALQSEARDRPLILDTGGLLTSQGPVRYAQERAPGKLAELIAQLGYRALVLGRRDLAGPRKSLVRLLAELRGRKIPVIASNLHCKASTQVLCDQLVDAQDGVSMHRVHGVKVAVIGLLPEDTLQRYLPERAAGLWLEPPGEVLARMTRQARSLGAQLVVASIDHGRGEVATGKAVGMADALPPDARPEILMSAHAGDHMLFARPAGVRPAVVAGPLAAVTEIRVRDAPIGQSHDVLARAASPAPQVAEALLEFIASIDRSYCRTWGRPLPAAELGRALDLQGTLDLVTGTLRDAAGAEIGLLDARTIDPEWSAPRGHRLTTGDVYAAIRYDDAAMVADVPASWVQQVAGKVDDRLHALGVATQADGTVTVAGRPLQSDARYHVVVTRSTVAEGLLPEGPDWQVLEGRTSRSILMDFLQEADGLQPREALEDPASSTVWMLRANADGTFAGATRSNPDAYDAAQLSGTESLALGMQTSFRADADHPQWGLENVGITRYQITRTGEGGGTAEGDDRLSVQSTLHWRGLQLGRPRWYVPDPYVEAYLESEFTVPDDRDFRHLLARPTTGMRFALREHLTLKLALGLETQLLDPQRNVLPGVGGEISLKPWNLMTAGDRQVQLQANLNYFVGGVLEENIQTVRGRMEASYDIGGLFALTWGLNLYAERRGSQPWALATNVNAGLRLRWNRRVSSY